VAIDLYLNNIDKIDDNTFASLSNLKLLDLNFNDLKDITAGMLNGVSLLEELFLARNYITAIRNDLFKQTPNLVFIDLYGNDVSSVQSTAFSGLTKLEI
jgi:Leucine-rich repeat (LRR) protein